jgi:hypothetical protein
MKPTDPPTDEIPLAILASGHAWLTPAEIAAILGQPVPGTESACRRLAALGLVSIWRRPDPVVTLSPSTARRLGVSLIEKGRSGELSWVPAGDPALQRSPRTRARIAGEATTWLADPAGFRPEHLEAGARSPRLLGTTFCGWPGPGAWAGGVCPICGSRPLAPREYCLGCDRLGASPAHARRASRPRARP